MTGTTAFAETYRAALHRYLAEPTESGLARGYDLGRHALERGLGIIDLLAVHNDAFRPLLGQQADTTIEDAATFLRECLAPLEMGYRGFLEANQTLRRVNAELENTVRQRTAELDHALCALREEVHARQRYAIEINDTIVQDLIAAEAASDLGRDADSRRLLRNASRAGRRWIGEQLREAGPLRAGSLVRSRAAEGSAGEGAMG